MDMITRNKANTCRVFEEGFGRGNLAVVDECIAAEAVDWHEFDPATPDMRSHVKAIIQFVRASLPDLAVTVEDAIGEGDRVAVRVTMRGTARDGAAVNVEQFHIVHCDEQGRGLRHWASLGELPAVIGAPA